MASKTFTSLLGLGDALLSNPDGPCVDTLAKSQARTEAGNHKAEVLACPGAFPALCAINSEDDVNKA